MNEEITALPEEVNGSDSVSLDNGTKPTEAAEISLNVPKRGGASEAVVPLNPSERPVRRATGPRSELGKRRSSRNATKYGIFSEVTVLKGESRAEYQSLLQGLWEALQPEGKLEELLVEKLATILWRHRRLIVAESAEILKSVEFLEAEEKNRQKENTYSFTDYELYLEGGLIRRIDNLILLQRCLELLAELRDGIERDGFDPDWDLTILKKLYGEYDEDSWRETLFGAYTIWVETSRTPEDERASKEYASPEKCKENFLEELDEEVARLKRYQKAHASMETNRRKLESLRQSVPDTPALDRLLRYEASLERSFDRTLSQLERLQRMRRGQPVLPPVKIELS